MCTLMRARLLSTIGASGLMVSAAVLVMPAMVTAQANLKTPWGEPDLQPRCVEGNYGHPALMLGARVEELAYVEGRGPHSATKDNATDFVGVEEDPFQ